MSERKAFELTPKDEDFSRWFDEVIFKSGILDERYPVKGMYVWLPFGYAIMEAIMGIMERLLRETGHRRVYFPGIVPQSVLGREFEFIKGFQDSVYWITQLGTDPAPEPMALRPTSEAIMYEVLSRWIQSYADLPIRIYQIVPVYRFETKATRPLIRVREIAFFKEGHTFHATLEEAVEQVELGVRIYREFYDELMVPYLVVKTLPWDTFPGARYNIDLITIMPDGKALELGSVINFGDLFARAYDLTYMDESGERRYVNTTSFGISERSLAAVIAIHGDDRGLKLPPEVAPVQVVVIPILRADEREAIVEKAREIYRRLKEVGFRVEIDESDERPGYKYYKWDMKGVPLKVDVGPQEAGGGYVSVARRDAVERIKIPESELEEGIRQVLAEYERSLREEADRYFQARLARAESFDEIRKGISEGKLVSFAWCGREECAHAVEDEIGYGILGYEEDALKGSEQPCIVCGSPSPHRAWIGRSY